MTRKKPKARPNTSVQAALGQTGTRRGPKLATFVAAMRRFASHYRRITPRCDVCNVTPVKYTRYVDRGDGRLLPVQMCEQHESIGVRDPYGPRRGDRSNDTRER